MANRRKRQQRIKEREANQKRLDELALELVSEGVPTGSRLGGVPSVQTALSFCVQNHLSGGDQSWEWPNKLGWLLHRHRYNEFVAMHFQTRVVSPDQVGLVGTADHSSPDVLELIQ